MYAFSENYVLPISHDEVVHGKGSLWTRMPGDDWNKAAGVRAMLAFMWAHPGKQLLFMGGEFGQVREWSEQRPLDWELLEDPLHAGVRSLVGDLNRAYRSRPALWSLDTTPEGFSWIDANDASGNVLSFLRFGAPDQNGTPDVVACIANFAGRPNEGYRVGLPFAGRWRELLNTDADAYGGSGVGNLGVVVAEQRSWHGRPASAVLRLPPSGVLWLVPDDTGGPVRRSAAAAAAGAPAAPATEAAPADGSAAGPAAAGPGLNASATSTASSATEVTPPGRTDSTTVEPVTVAGASASTSAPNASASSTTSPSTEVTPTARMDGGAAEPATSTAAGSGRPAVERGAAQAPGSTGTE